MLRNYFKLALRNLLKHRGITAINLLGLTVGLGCCLLIGIYIANELSFDRYHGNAERIWRVNRKFFNKDGTMQLDLGHVAPPFGPLLKNEFSAVEESARLLQSTITLRRDDELFLEENFFYAEPAVFRIFDIPMVQGVAALDEPNTLLLNQSAAKRIFGDRDPVDQVLRFDTRGQFRVAGVFRDFPYNSHFHPDFLASFSTLHDTTIYGEEQLRTNWGNNSFSTYLLLPEGYRAEQLESQFPAFLDKVMSQAMANASANAKPSDFTRLHLTPLTDIHLKSHLDSEIEANSDIKRVYIFSAIALFVLLIACVNYMNLATASAAARAKEIGIRKVVGALRRELVGQFLTEAVLLTSVSTLLATGLALLVLPAVNKMLGQELSLLGTPIGVIAAATGALALAAGLLAGIYPAFFLSGLRPLKTMKGEVDGAKTGGSVGLRKILVIGQFAISAGLIIATLTVYRQLDFMQAKNLGLNKDQVVTLNFYPPLAARYDAFRNEMLASPAIKNVTRSSRLPSGRLLDSYGSAQLQFDADTLQPTSVDLKMVTIDHRFFPLFDIGMAAGRNYREDAGADRFASFIVNESAVRHLGIPSAESIVGKRIKYGGRDAQVVGVVRDFNFESLHQDILPMIFYIPRDSTFFNFVSVKIDAGRPREALAHIQSVWQTFLPDFPYDYSFLDEQYGELYQAEQRQGRVFIVFALIAILVACLGLFGLASFVTRQRVKEIGIRKVLGASVAGITGLLAKDFLKLVLIAIVIASPLAWYVMNRWLADFAYRIDISWWMFAAAGLLALAIAFVTVGFQSVRAALANPVKSLRSE